MYMQFGYNPQTIFRHFFCNLNLVVFSGILTMKVYGHSFYSFIPILLKLYRCLDRALKICMWFVIILRLILTLFMQFELKLVFREFTQ